MFRSAWSKFRGLPIAAQVIAWVLAGGLLLGLTGVLQPPRPASVTYPIYPTSPPSYSTPTYTATPTFTATPIYTPTPTATYEPPPTTEESAPVYVNPPDVGDGDDHHPGRRQVCKHTILLTSRSAG